MKRQLIALILASLLVLAVVGTALSASPNPNPGVIPNNGPHDPKDRSLELGSQKYKELSIRWWQWALSFPAADVPYFNTGGPVDISAGQSGNVWFLAGANFGLTEPRTGVVPAGKSLFFPLANLINDYPCPPPTPPDPPFEPPPGQTLERFLQETGNFYQDLFVPDPTLLFAEIAEIDGDEKPLTGLPGYRVTSRLFSFTADPALGDPESPFYSDPCINGTEQYGVALGYWLLLPPLTPGTHTLHFGVGLAPGGFFSQDVTYILTVTPGR